jgi:protein-disulfide isomerase
MKVSWRQTIETATHLAIIVFCGTVTWHLAFRASVPGFAPPRPSSPPLSGPAIPREPLTLDSTAARGSRNAKVALIEYSDFQCPYCAKFAKETLPLVEGAYIASGKVMLAFRHMPLPNLHPFAKTLAEAAACAGEQGRFWNFHDRFFLADAKSLSEVDVLAAAESEALDKDAFAECRRTSGPKTVQSDLESARSLGVTGTPTLFLGRVLTDGRVKVETRLSGAAPFERLRREIDALLLASTGS